MFEGIDTAVKITAEQARNLRSAGISFAARYLVPETGATAWKALTAREAQDIREAGLALMLCWETTADRCKGGATAGAEDGAKAAALAGEMGVPMGTCIYFAADYDVPESDIPAVEAYYRAARIACSPYNAGIYGGERVVSALSAITAWLWQCVAWSDSFVPYATVRQYQWQGSPDAKALAAKVGFAVDLDSAETLAGMWMPTKNDGEDKKMKKDWKKFLLAAGIRALRTLAQTAVATIGTSALLSEVNWPVVASASVLAAILSILTSVATGLPEVGGNE